MTYSISYRNDPFQPGEYNGLYAMPSDRHWRIVSDAVGEISRFDTAAEAEAAAGHVLVNHLNREAES